jgi:hypothetical protein
VSACVAGAEGNRGTGGAGGGAGTEDVCEGGGGGGGGGYYGGGGGGSGVGAGGGGGAGSSYIDTAVGSGSVAVNSGEPKEKIVITYTVPASVCTSIHGWGRVGSAKEEGVLIFDELSTRKGARERFEAGIQKPKFGQVRLTGLTSASCTQVSEGREFAGYGPATLKGVPGYVAKFAFVVTTKEITFSLTLTKEEKIVYTTEAPMLKGSVEIISPPPKCLDLRSAAHPACP